MAEFQRDRPRVVCDVGSFSPGVGAAKYPPVGSVFGNGISAAGGAGCGSGIGTGGITGGDCGAPQAAKPSAIKRLSR